MSIPLDRLYNYIKDISKEIYSDDLIIYRFNPHGSKKLSDLIFLDDQISNDQDLINLPCMICHDQEPLNFDLYSGTPECVAFAKTTYYPHAGLFQEVLQFYLDMNLRMALTLPYNLYDCVLLCHSEKNGQNLKKYESTGFVGVYWWCHAVIARDWFRFAEHTQQNKKQSRKTFLIYNRAWCGSRQYRLKFLDLIVLNNLQDHCKTWFNPIDPDLQIHYQELVNTPWRPNIKLEDYFSKTDASANASADFEMADYESTDIEVILETVFDDDRWHLTEKTLRAIACGQPFILAGSPGSLTYLQSYGFKTFASVWNESYDKEFDHDKRLKMIAHEMKIISQWDEQTKQQKMQLAIDIANYNKKLFFSSEFHKSIEDELKQNLDSAINKMKQLKNGKYYLEIKKIKEKNPEIKKLMDQIDQQKNKMSLRNNIENFIDTK